MTNFLFFFLTECCSRDHDSQLKKMFYKSVKWAALAPWTSYFWHPFAIGSSVNIAMVLNRDLLMKILRDYIFVLFKVPVRQ